MSKFQQPDEIKDLKQRLWGIPAVAAAVTVLSLSWQAEPSLSRTFIHFLVSIGITTLLWHTSRGTIIYMRRRMPHYRQTLKRLLWQTLISQSIVILSTTVLCNLILYFIQGTWPALNQILPTLLVSVQVTLIISLIYEAVFFFERWKQAIIDTESLQLEQLRSRYELLRQQVSPHFLFNSLNTLAAIIPEDPATAETFVQKLAQVYRHVLRHAESNAVPLREELECVEAYIYLHRVRAGDHIHLQLDLPENDLNRPIPPNALQLLVENAIKHNIVSASRPLQIRISASEQGLEVSNNLQRRQTVPESTHVGLKNLKERYRILSGKEPELLETESLFLVKLPHLA